MRDQLAIIQDIIFATADALNDGWQEFIVDYYVDDSQSGVLKSFVIERPEGLTEVPIGYLPELERLLRELRAILATGGKEAFTRCTLRVDAFGKYEATYSYDPVVWSSLLQPGWHFPEASIKG